jgi:hypothetical protein
MTRIAPPPPTHTTTPDAPRANALFRGTRPLKRWRYVGVFSQELMLCAASVQVGPARQSFWAVLTRADGELRERTHTLGGRGAVALAPGRLWLHERNRSVQIDLEIEEDSGWETTCPHGKYDVWTRKQAGVPVQGTWALDGGKPRPLQALAVVDDTVGYHARATEWRWAAGVGSDPQGRSLAFNLVEGVNDPPTGSERAVWVNGTPHEAPPVRFAQDLSAIRAADGAADGSELRFTPEAERHRRENLLIVRSEYRAPFGVFSGTLPDGTVLTHGLGVMEHHRAAW